MEKVRIEAVESRPAAATVCRPLTDALDATGLALNYYELAPGASFAFGYHAHEGQEELFAILEGVVTFETESGEVEVDAGEVIRFGPGEFQQGVNEGEERVIALAIGAPRERGESTILRDCEACGDRTPHTIERADDAPVLLTRCLECSEVTGRFE